MVRQLVFDQKANETLKINLDKKITKSGLIIGSVCNNFNSIKKN